MKNTKRAILSIAFGSLILPVAGFAATEKTDGFVCPVLHPQSQSGVRNPNAVPIGGGDYSIIGPNVGVPLHATNGNGAGSPGGAHSSPGDSDYTALWSGN